MVTARVSTFPRALVQGGENEGVAYEPRFQEIPQLTALVPTQYAQLACLVGHIEEELLVGALRDGRLRVRVPFSVRFTPDEQCVVAEATEFNEFGFGENWSEALADLQRAVAELFFTLKDEQHRLGPDLQTVWTALRDKVEERPAGP